MKTAVISGITGQDGVYLANFLLGKGYKVIGLIPSHRSSDYFRLNYLGIREKIVLRKIDLLIVKEIEIFLEDTKPDEFYNLAAISSVGISFQQPYETFGFNTTSVINILECIRKVTPQTRFYQASSSEMFGNIGHDRLPIRESFLFHPVSPYGISKASAHWLAVNYREAYKLNTCCGILFNHESALRPPHFVIKKIIRGAIEISKGRKEKLILGNIAIIRDWGYAPFYVEAMWQMMQQEKLDDYLICSGTSISLENFIVMVFNQLDLQADQFISIDSSLKRSLDLEIIFGDNAKAKKELNWHYQLSTVDLIKKLIADENDFMTWESSLNSPK